MDIELVKKTQKAFEWYDKAVDNSIDYLNLEREEQQDAWNALDKLFEALARQTVKSEEVAEAITQLEIMATNMMGEIQNGNKLVDVHVKTLDLAITALHAYQPWVSVGERLPEIPEGRYGVMCNVMVDNCSSTKVMSLLYEKDTVRGKTVCRWKWYGKISPWNVTHWKPLPEIPRGNNNEA